MYYTAKAEILFFHFLFAGLKIVCTFAARVEPERVFLSPPAGIIVRLFCSQNALIHLSNCTCALNLLHFEHSTDG